MSSPSTLPPLPPPPFRFGTKKQHTKIRKSQVVRCGPDDAFPAALQIASGGSSDASQAPAASKNGGAEKEKDVRWAAAPAMEVALVKQTERDVSYRQTCAVDGGGTLCVRVCVCVCVCVCV